MRNFRILCVDDTLDTFNTNTKQIFTTVDEEKENFSSSGELKLQIRKWNHIQKLELHNIRFVYKRPTSSGVLFQLKLSSNFIENKNESFLKGTTFFDV